jgi:hypothetical protein
MATFQALGRNGNWPVTVAVGDTGNTAMLRATLPLAVRRKQRDAVADLAARLNSTVAGRFIGPDRGGRMLYELAIPSDAATVPEGIEIMVHTVDRHLPGFFAVAGGAQTPSQAVDQLERRRIYA